MNTPTMFAGVPKPIAEAIQAHGAGFMRGRLIEIDRQLDKARREAERLDATAEYIRAALARLDGQP